MVNQDEIKFEDIFNLSGLKYENEEIKPEQVKVKFNIHNNNGVKTRRALDCLFHDEKEWLNMVGHYDNVPPYNHKYGEAKYVLAFAQYYLLGTQYFLFGGFYRVDLKKNAISKGKRGYKLELLEYFSKYIKRVVIKKEKSSNESLNMWYNTVLSNKYIIFETLPPNSTDLDPFSGYDKVRLSFEQLKSVEYDAKWKEALASVKGIYCITDKSNGKLYIGSATGEHGIWGRWESYLKNFDGGNKSFKEKRQRKGKEYFENNFQYSILEIFDTRSRSEDILSKEQYWMKVFNSVEKGYNNKSGRGRLGIKNDNDDIKRDVQAENDIKKQQSKQDSSNTLSS